MKIIKFIQIILFLLTYVLISFIIHLFTFKNPDTRLRMQSSLNHDLARAIRRLLHLKVTLDGEALRSNTKGSFIISNHLGYLDGIVLGSIFKVIYVSKLEVKSWGLFGIMANLGGTIFIDRKRKDLSKEYTDKIGNLLKKDINILLFPEGTSTNGFKLLSFQSLFFASPIIAKSPIQPVTVSYTHINGNKLEEKDRDRVCWYGQKPFVNHMFELLSLRSINAKVKIHPVMSTSFYEGNSLDRHNLAKTAYEVILKG